MDQDVKVLKKTLEWIERSTSDRMKRATAEYIYDRYIRHPPQPKIITKGDTH